MRPRRRYGDVSECGAIGSRLAPLIYRGVYTVSSGCRIEPICCAQHPSCVTPRETSRLSGFKGFFEGRQKGLADAMFSFDQTSAARERNNTFGSCGVPNCCGVSEVHDRALKLAGVCQRRTACQRLRNITITQLVIMSGQPTITKRQQSTTRPRSTKRPRTTHIWLTATINTQFITTPRPRNCMPSSATAWQRPPPSKEPRKRAPLKRGSFRCPCPVDGE